jgi:prophage tail gpP-like protein
MSTPDDTLSLVIASQSFTGWTSIRVSRSCERCPSSFDIFATELDRLHQGVAQMPPGAPCQVRIGADLILTGYVDRVLRSVGPSRHEVRIQGRGKCEDIVDTSVNGHDITGMEITTSSLLDPATKLCAKLNITASSLTGDNAPLVAANGAGPLIFNANLQQTLYEILEAVASYAGVLIYEGVDGNLVISKVGTTSMASGFQLGTNVQNAVSSFTMDERFSVYLPCLMSTNFFGEQGIGGTQFPPVFDKAVPRYRPHVVVSDQFIFGTSLAERAAQWEAARRWGRSQMLRVTVDSWRDEAGALWAPNTLAPLDLPPLGLTGQSWVIGGVDFVRDSERGTVADLQLMPAQAFIPQPSILFDAIVDPNAGLPDPAGGGATNNPAPTPGPAPAADAGALSTPAPTGPAAVLGTGGNENPLGTPAPGPAPAPAGGGAALGTGVNSNPLGSGVNNDPLGL